MEKLKPCPFCGGEAYFDSCDRIINIGCHVCNYHISFKGLLTTVPHGDSVSAPESAIKEYYNPNAHEEAVAVWNKRTNEQQKPVVHGRWMKSIFAADYYKCSECCAVWSRRFKFCPNCGARMEGGNGNESD